MFSGNLRILILEQELQRISEYVSRVPHRATGGLLMGNRFTRSGVDYLIISHTTVGVPDEKMPDESCANHPLYTAEDAARATAGPTEARFLGRWHAHPDGMNRPSSGDLDWAMSLLREPAVALEELLHPIAVSSADEVRLFPYMVTRDGLTFQRVHWQVATQSEVDQVRLNQPAPQAPQPAFDPQIFSLQKTRDRLREERDTVAALPGVVRCEVFEQGATAILEAEVDFTPDRMLLQVAAGALYPVHAPTLRVTLNGESRSFSSKVLREWNSACQIEDVVKEAVDRLKPSVTDDSVPLPAVDETDPRKREAALLKAAGYVIQLTATDTNSILLAASSPVLEAQRKRFFAILPGGYPEEPPALAFAEPGVPVSDISFEMMAEVPPGFTLLGWVERMMPAARQERARALKERTPLLTPAVMFLYFCVFLMAAGAGYLYKTGLYVDIESTVRRFVASMRDAGTTPSTTTAPVRETATPVRSVPGKMTLTPNARVLAVVVDAGRMGGITEDEAKWVVTSALRGIEADSVQVDLQDLDKDLGTVRTAAEKAQALIVFTMEAGPNQARLVDSLRVIGLPIGVVSLMPGEKDQELSSNITFFRPVERPGGKSGAQRTLLALKKEQVIEVQGAP